MNDVSHDTRPEPLTAPADDRGWYLYGVAEQETSGTVRAAISPVSGIDGHPVSVVDCGTLTAIVSPVSTADFLPESLSARAADADWLEAMVRAHNEVIDAVHMRTTILPAKFGSVYRRADDLLRALEPSGDAMRAQLQRLRETDEWAVHVYADRTVVQEDIAANDADIHALRSQLADARPGRAFFLQRKLADELATLTESALVAAAQSIHERILPHALEYALSSPARVARVESGKVEILRAAYLVRRQDTDHFLQTADSAGQDYAGMDMETTGPWPPYSFVTGVAVDSP